MKKIPIFFILLFFVSFLAHEAGAEEVLTWGVCLSEARKNHPDLISAEEAINQSESAKQISASSGYPQVDASLDMSIKQTSGKTSSGSTTRATTQSDSVGINGTQVLFDGGKISDTVKAAAENIIASKHNFRFVSSEVRFRLRSAFVNLLKAQESIQIKKDISKIRKSNLELITLRYESGIEHRGALLNAQANVAEAEFEISQAERALEVAQRQLLREMGRMEFSDVRVQGDFTVNPAELEKPDFELLAMTHPSLGKLVAQMNAAAFGMKSAEADFFPKITAQAGAGRTNNRWPPENDQWNAGLTVSYPLFEGGLRKAQVSQAQSVYNQTVADTESARGNIVVTLEQTWASLRDTVGTVDVQNKFLTAAEERSKIAEEQYSLGLIKFDDWTIIEDNLVSAKKNYLEAQANALLAEANWVQAKGETLEYAQ